MPAEGGPTRGLLALGAGAAVLLATYVPAACQRFGILDDYTQLVWHLQREPSRFKVFIASGRPGQAIMESLTFGATGGIDGFVWLRLATLATVMLFLLLLARQLVRSGWTVSEAAAIAVIVGTVPPFQVYVMWPTMGVTLPAAVVSALGVLLAVASSRRTGPSRMALAAGAVACLVAALVTHQVVAMFGWLFLAAGLLRPDSVPPLREFAREARWVAALTAVALAIAFVVWKAGLAWYPDELPPGRTRVAVDLPDKARFFARSLEAALSLSTIPPSFPVAVTVALLTVVGLLRFLPGTPGERTGRLLVLLLLLPAACLPSLVAAESNPTYRAQGPLTAMVVLLLCCAVRGLIGRRTICGAILACWALAASATAHMDVSAYLAVPNHQELTDLEHRLAARDPSRPLWVILRPWHDTVGPTPPMDDYGVPTCSQKWAIESVVVLLRHESGGALPGGDIRAVLGEERPPPGAEVLDTRLDRRPPAVR